MEPTNETSGVEHKPMGPIIGSIIVVLLIVLGGLYFWGERLNTEDLMKGGSTDKTVENLRTQGTTDGIESIEKDAAASDFNNLDSDLNNIGTELNNL